MLIAKIKRKSKTLFQVLGFVYGRYTGTAILRDILFIISTAASIYSITILGKFLDSTAELLLQWETFDIREYFGTDSFFFLATVLGLWMVVQIATQYRRYLYNMIYEKVWADSKYLMVSKIAKSDLQDVEKEDFQDLLTFAPAYSIDRIITAYDNFSTIISNAFSFVSAIVILYATLSWSVVIIFFLVLPEVISVHFRRKNIRKFTDNEVGRFRFLNYLEYISYDVSIFPELRVDGIFSHIKRQFKGEYDEYLTGYQKVDKAFYDDVTIFSIIGQSLKFVYIIYLLSIAVIQRFSIGSFKALYDYVATAYTSIYTVLNSFSLLSTKLDYIDDFFNLIDYHGFGDVYHGNTKLNKDITPSLELKDLSFAYPDDPNTKILKNLNIKIEPGEKIVFFGGDGSGKSSMVKIMTGLYEILDGDYIIDGTSIRELDRGQLKKKLAVTFQNFINYSFSLKENIVIAGDRVNINKDLYEKVKRLTGVSSFMKKEKIEDSHLLGKQLPGGKDFSPGYWQRLAIARMLYRNRKIFIMDEPFTYIDSTWRGEILENVLKFIGEDRTLIFITRETEFLDKFDRIYYFKDGKIVEAGDWKELMKKKGKLYEQAKDN